VAPLSRIIVQKMKQTGESITQELQTKCDWWRFSVFLAYNNSIPVNSQDFNGQVLVNKCAVSFLLYGRDNPYLLSVLWYLEEAQEEELLEQINTELAKYGYEHASPDNSNEKEFEI